MKKNIKQIWVKALRSGEFKQGQGRLYEGTSKRYCCLGVLTKLYINQHKLSGKNLSDLIVGLSNREEVNGFPGRKVLEWSGLHHSTCDTLAEMNDDTKSFREIADYIEKKL